MATVVGICNRALSYLKAQPITSLTDGTESARIVSRVYDYLRDELLRAHPWNFATKRAALARLSTTPAWGYDYQFALPTDCLRVLAAVGSDETEISDFKIESRNLLTNEEAVYLLYVYRVTDPAQYDALFSAALSYRIISEIAYELTSSTAAAEASEKMFDRRISEARGVDAREGTPETVYRPTTWYAARFGGRS